MRSTDNTSTGNVIRDVDARDVVVARRLTDLPATALRNRSVAEQAPQAGPAAVKPSETKASSRPSSAPFLYDVYCEAVQ